MCRVSGISTHKIAFSLSSNAPRVLRFFLLSVLGERDACKEKKKKKIHARERVTRFALCLSLFVVFLL